MNKRLFFAAPVQAAWPEDLPQGRILDEKVRHITIAFLGLVPVPGLAEIPDIRFTFAPAGFCRKWALLKHVAAAEPEWLTGKDSFFRFHDELKSWLLSKDYPVDPRPFYPHITAARTPLDRKTWEKTPCRVPFFLSGIYLYESLGNHTYVPLWGQKLIPPFEEIEHTADIAFNLQAPDLKSLFAHAQLALAFKFPQLVSYMQTQEIASLDELISRLNGMIAEADRAVGCPFKAVSYYGHLTKQQDGVKWTMIVDV